MHKAYQTFIRTYHYILDFVVPRYCVGCGKERDSLCEKCQNALYKTWANCLVCGSRNMTGAFCAGSCRKKSPLALKKVFWISEYADVLKKAILQLKYRRRTELAEPLGILLAKKFISYIGANFHPADYIIIPIPLHPAKQQERRFNQAELIARSFAKETGIAIETNVLKKIINTQPQARISNREERLQNLTNAFSVLKSKSDFHNNYGSRTSIVVLIDDVSTTGATLFEASNALSAGGFTKIIGLVLAHG